VHRVHEKGDALGENLAVLLPLFLARLLDMRFERRCRLAQRDHLASQAIRGRPGRFDGSGCNGLDLAQTVFDAFANHPFQRLGSFLGQLAR